MSIDLYDAMDIVGDQLISRAFDSENALAVESLSTPCYAQFEVVVKAFDFEAKFEAMEERLLRAGGCEAFELEVAELSVDLANFRRKLQVRGRRRLIRRWG